MKDPLPQPRPLEDEDELRCPVKPRCLSDEDRRFLEETIDSIRQRLRCRSRQHVVEGAQSGGR